MSYGLNYHHQRNGASNKNSGWWDRGLPINQPQQPLHHQPLQQQPLQQQPLQQQPLQQQPLQQQPLQQQSFPPSQLSTTTNYHDYPRPQQQPSQHQQQQSFQWSNNKNQGQRRGLLPTPPQVQPNLPPNGQNYVPQETFYQGPVINPFQGTLIPPFHQPNVQLPPSQHVLVELLKIAEMSKAMNNFGNGISPPLNQINQIQPLDFRPIQNSQQTNLNNWPSKPQNICQPNNNKLANRQQLTNSNRSGITQNKSSERPEENQLLPLERVDSQSTEPLRISPGTKSEQPDRWNEPESSQSNTHRNVPNEPQKQPRKRRPRIRKRDKVFGGVPVGSVNCTICIRAFGGSKDFLHHLNGRPHRQQLKVRAEIYNKELRDLKVTAKVIEHKQLIELKRKGDNKALAQHCAVCDVQFTGDAAVHEKLETHKKLMPYYRIACEQCNYTCRSRIELDVHTSSVDHIRKVGLANYKSRETRRKEAAAKAQPSKTDEGQEMCKQEVGDTADKNPDGSTSSQINEENKDGMKDDEKEIRKEDEGVKKEEEIKEKIKIEEKEAEPCSSPEESVNIASQAPPKDLAPLPAPLEVLAPSSAPPEVLAPSPQLPPTEVEHNQAIEEPRKKRPAKINPLYDPNVPFGLEAIVPKTGFMCTSCNIFLPGEHAVQIHSMSRNHFDKHILKSAKKRRGGSHADKNDACRPENTADRESLKRPKIEISFKEESGSSGDNSCFDLGLSSLSPLPPMFWRRQCVDLDDEEEETDDDGNWKRQRRSSQRDDSIAESVSEETNGVMDGSTHSSATRFSGDMSFSSLPDPREDSPQQASITEDKQSEQATQEDALWSSVAQDLDELLNAVDEDEDSMI